MGSGGSGAGGVGFATTALACWIVACAKRLPVCAVCTVCMVNDTPHRFLCHGQFFISRIMSTSHVCGPVIRDPPHGSILLEMADDEVQHDGSYSTIHIRGRRSVGRSKKRPFTCVTRVAPGGALVFADVSPLLLLLLLFHGRLPTAV